MTILYARKKILQHKNLSFPGQANGVDIQGYGGGSLYGLDQVDKEKVAVDRGFGVALYDTGKPTYGQLFYATGKLVWLGALPTATVRW
ncbi:MAG: hypothetical protein GF398_17175 [Chitinivibrionales bacterium]|nr:hypothetical protein [Chitinivibrionales bacterium]